ncbi:GNAT family N-acetyltransferase [Kutzneria sp. NPDC052558]|uniref:GNAT family N-acetyltransferase n=1 Tax=Kutzneria sp. NPDC052558 TaxID=3364121 RepID=UPI0037C91E4C
MTLGETTLDVRPFDGRRATEAEIDEYHELRCAVYRVDIPEMPTPTRSETVSRLAAPQLILGDRLMWFARLDGRLAGTVSVYMLDEGGKRVAIVQVLVRPDLRRQGIGTQLLRGVVPTLREAGRTEVQGWDITADGAGDHWTKSLGFRVVHTTVLQVLTFAEVDPGLWDVAVPEGYRLVSWTDTAPDDVLEPYVAALGGLADATSGDSGVTLSDWSVERVRQLEADYAEHGIERRSILAVNAEGEAAGVTELEQRPQNPERLFQGATAVLADHRGHGLGVAMKAAMLRWFTADNEGLREVWTSTGSDNTHMIEVNCRLGFEIARRSSVVSLPL